MNRKPKSCAGASRAKAEMHTATSMQRQVNTVSPETWDSLLGLYSPHRESLPREQRRTLEYVQPALKPCGPLSSAEPLQSRGSKHPFWQCPFSGCRSLRAAQDCTSTLSRPRHERRSRPGAPLTARSHASATYPRRVGSRGPGTSNPRGEPGKVPARCRASAEGHPTWRCASRQT